MSEEFLWSDERIAQELNGVGGDGDSVRDVLIRMRDHYQEVVDNQRRALEQLRTMYRAAVRAHLAAKKEVEELRQAKTGWW